MCDGWIGVSAWVSSGQLRTAACCSLLLLLTVKQNESLRVKVISCFGCLHELVSV